MALHDVSEATTVEGVSYRSWAVGPEKMSDLIRDGKILWPKSIKGRPRIKRFLADLKSETTGLSTFIEASANIAGTREINEMFGSKVFAFPNPASEQAEPLEDGA
jgi:adenine-specific DNA-methyltransferase